LTIKFTLDTEYLLALTIPYIDFTAWLQLVLPINIQLSKIRESVQLSALSFQLLTIGTRSGQACRFDKPEQKSAPRQLRTDC
jgi:hypothetical protein